MMKSYTKPNTINAQFEKEITVELPKVRIHVFIFYNPKSGNRQGTDLENFAAQYVRLKKDPSIQIQMFNLLDTVDNQKGFNYLFKLYNEGKGMQNYPTKRLYVFSAGGDGTFIGVLEQMRLLGINILDKRILFSAFPFGTGNDLTQALHWENVIPIAHTKTFERFYDYIKKRLEGVEQPMDIWLVRCTTKTSFGYIEKTKKTSPNVEQNEEYQDVNVMERMMSNYMSLGLQGAIGRGFEKRRKNSRFLNILEYVRQCFQRGIITDVERLNDYFTSITAADGSIYRTCDKNVSRSVELVIQNVPGLWGRQINVWDNCKMEKKAVVCPEVKSTNKRRWGATQMGDGKLEVFCLKSRRDYMKKQISCALGLSKLARFGQFEKGFKIKCLPESIFHMMVDGEFYKMFDIDTITVEHIGQIQVLTGPLDGKNNPI